MDRTNGFMYWPAENPDKNPIYFFVWKCMRQRVYGMLIVDAADLHKAIFVAADEI